MGKWSFKTESKNLKKNGGRLSGLGKFQYFCLPPSLCKQSHVKKKLILSILLIFLSASLTSVFSQNKIVAVIGSSTAAGVGPSVSDSSWVRRLSNHYKSLGILDTIYNRAMGGYTSYKGMPTSYTPPPDRPAPDPERDITKAITLNPNVIIISFVSNGFDTYTIPEIKMTLFTMFDSATTRAGKVAFVTTTQPRTSFTPEGRLKLRKLKDSIISWFGNYAINFWNPIADSTDNSIAPQYRSAFDDIHLNDAGHRVLFEQVLAKNIFAQALVPVKLLQFKAVVDLGHVQLQWTAETADKLGKFFIQCSLDGVHFETIGSVKALTGKINYTFADPKKLRKQTFYRLEIQENDQKSYSKTLTVTERSAPVSLGKPFPVPAGDVLHFSLKCSQNVQAEFSIINVAGKEITSFYKLLDPAESILSFPISHLARGSYFIRMEYPGSTPLTQSFLKY